MSLLTYTPLGKAWTESCYPKVWCYKGQGKRAVQVITALTFSNPLDSVHLFFSHFQGLCRSYLCMDNFNSSRRGNIVVNWIACKMFPHLFPCRNAVYFKYTFSILIMYFPKRKYSWSILHLYLKKKSINEVHFVNVLHLYLKCESILQVYLFSI